MQDGYRLGVRPVSVQIEWLDGHRFRLCGPKACVRLLKKMGGERALIGKLSPPAAITVEGRNATRIGVPKGAQTFAFAYPLPLQKEAVDLLVESAVRSASRPKSGEFVLASLDDTPAWLDFCLVGGFFYMDKHEELLQTNSLGLQLDGVRHQIHYSGPHACSTRAGEAMTRAGRMEDVTLEVLRDGGEGRHGCGK